MANVLVIEDDAAIAELLALNLRHEGYAVSTAPNAARGAALVSQALPDLVILDWMLPGEPGIELARRWHAESRTRSMPIVMLTARAEEQDLLQALDAGADDFIAKPFSMLELLARVRAVLRRTVRDDADEPVVVGRARLDPLTRSFYLGEREVPVPATQFRLLRYLMANPGRVHTRSRLLETVWVDRESIDERTVDVYIKRLRGTLSEVGCSHLVETVQGDGYRLAADPGATA